MSEPKRAHTKSDNKHRQEYDKTTARDALAAAAILNSEPTEAKMRKQAYEDLSVGSEETTSVRSKAARKLVRAIRNGQRLPKGEHEGLMRIYADAADRKEQEREDHYDSDDLYWREANSSVGYGPERRAIRRGRDLSSKHDREHQKSVKGGKPAPQRFLYKKVKDPVKK